MRGYQPKFPVTPCQFPVNNVATLTGIVTAWACVTFKNKFGQFLKSVILGGDCPLPKVFVQGDDQ